MSAKLKQYGIMRAVCMDERQITEMIVAEALTYALSGCIVG
nr:FtsX-like permease family protein [Sedimentibacter sp.]